MRNSLRFQSSNRGQMTFQIAIMWLKHFKTLLSIRKCVNKMASKRRLSQVEEEYPHSQESVNSSSVEEAIRCFSSGTFFLFPMKNIVCFNVAFNSGDPQDLSKQKSKTFLDALEEYYERNLNDDCAKCGLSQEQTNKVIPIHLFNS